MSTDATHGHPPAGMTEGATGQGPVDVETLVTRAREIAPEIAAAAGQAEKERRIPDRIIDLIHESGIHQMLVPRRFGGYEMSIPDFVTVMKALSPLDTSAGWTNSFYVGHNWMWCLLPEAAQKEIFADGPSARGPVMVAPSVSATPVDGGYRINGRAKWGTGSSHAHWCMVSGVVQSNAAGPPELRMFALPWQDARTEDTWHTSGMAATASNDVLFENVFIPGHRSVAIQDIKSGNPPGAKVHANPLYRAPFTPFLCLIAVTPLVAVARGVTLEATARAKTFVSSYSGKTSIDNPALQIRLAKCDVMSRAAETLLDELASDLERSAAAGVPSIEDRVLMRAKASYIASLCRSVVTLLAQGSGASAHMTDSTIQRAFRDISMAACHVVFDEDPTMELHGKVLVGLPPEFILA